MLLGNFDLIQKVRTNQIHHSCKTMKNNKLKYKVNQN